MKRIFLSLLVLVITVALLGFTGTISKLPPKKLESVQLNKKVKSIVYNNTRYRFTFNLPGSWKNYRIIIGKWEGVALGGAKVGKIVQTGPKLSIRHPKWTQKNQRQDIPIMIFTLAQWNMLQSDIFHIGAAPIGPRELGRNSKYVFALPARYNFAFQTGYQEVENILNSKPLHPNDMK